MNPEGMAYGPPPCDARALDRCQPPRTPLLSTQPLDALASVKPLTHRSTTRTSPTGAVHPRPVWGRARLKPPTHLHTFPVPIGASGDIPAPPVFLGGVDACAWEPEAVPAMRLPGERKRTASTAAALPAAVAHDVGEWGVGQGSRQWDTCQSLGGAWRSRLEESQHASGKAPGVPQPRSSLLSALLQMEHEEGAFGDRPAATWAGIDEENYLSFKDYVDDTAAKPREAQTPTSPPAEESDACDETSRGRRS
eukprot:TRINITY_DN3265_c0_g1_i9.p2 TRINITY_DN3265_c0_g1~~TRINITY_DN3265_c0_g1_i9.p2  ORF type:complete len:251 (+),score=14.26 TRINITY_DN3265_c0_g1_i9:841-1593(+)